MYLRRALDRAEDRGSSRQVHDGVQIGRHRPVANVTVAEIADDRVSRAVGELVLVGDHDRVTTAAQLCDDVAPDEPGTARDENP